MGRTYIRKTQRGADGSRYTSESLAKALEDLQNQRKTLKGASKAYNIPRTTLRRHLRSQIKGRPASGGSGGGRATDLTFEQEKRLADCLKILEKWGFGLTRYEVLEAVQIFVTTNNLKTRFKNNKPGEEWYLAFAKRHGLSLKKPQGVEYQRIDQINPFVIYSYFDLLEETVKSLNLEDKPHQIFNLDESSFCHDPSKAKVVGARGAKSTRMISSPGRENTILICCSASGDKIPPLVIFKGKNVLEHWLNINETDKTFYTASQKGWMESTIFAKWFKQCFLPSAPKERPLLLIYDGHATHVSIEVIEVAVLNQIVILKLPPHTTHYLQPMDSAVFKSLKNSWEKELLVWQRQNPRQRIPKSQFVTILNRIYDKLTEDIIKNGFKVSGIYPLNRDVIPKSIFKPEDLKLYEQKKKNIIVKKANITETPASTPEVNESDFLSKDINNKNNFPGPSSSLLNEGQKDVPNDFNNEDFNASLDLNLGDEHAGVSDLNISFLCEDQNSILDGILDNADLAEETFQDHIKPVEQTEKSIINSNLELIRTPELGQSNKENLEPNGFESVLLKFIKGPNASSNQMPKFKSRKRLCPNSEIITTKEYLEKRKTEEMEKKRDLEEKEKRKKNALEKKQERQRKECLKIPQTGTFLGQHVNVEAKKKAEKNENNISIQQHPKINVKKRKKQISSSSESDISFAEDESNSDESDDGIEVLTDDFVVVRYEMEYYPGQVLKVELDQVTVKHMEKSGKMDGWKWPKLDDVLQYNKKEILKIIPPPTPVNKRGVFKVPYMARFS